MAFWSLNQNSLVPSHTFTVWSPAKCYASILYVSLECIFTQLSRVQCEVFSSPALMSLQSPDIQRGGQARIFSDTVTVTSQATVLAELNQALTDAFKGLTF